MIAAGAIKTWALAFSKFKKPGFGKMTCYWLSRAES
jgi:hypothetical protein